MTDLKLGKATATAPLVAPVMYWLGVYLFGGSVPDGFKDAVFVFALISAFALPVSYAATVVIGLPVLKVLRKANKLTARNVVLVGVVAGGVLFSAFVLLFGGFDLELLAFPLIAWYLAAGSAMGAGVAYTFSVVSGITKPSSGRSR